MKKACFCGRRGEITDREPIPGDDGRWALRCLDCGHTDYLEWLPEEASLALWGEAKRRREELITHN